MSVVIDVDAHFEPGNDWLIPYPELAAKLTTIDMTHVATDSTVGDILLDAPAAQPLSEAPSMLDAMFSTQNCG